MVAKDEEKYSDLAEGLPVVEEGHSMSGHLMVPCEPSQTFSKFSVYTASKEKRKS